MNYARSVVEHRMLNNRNKTRFRTVKGVALQIPTILIIESDLKMQHLLTNALHNEGYDPVVVSNGKTALQTFLTTYPDVVLLAIHLPDLNGFEVCEEIRKLSNVPIIFVSAAKDPDDIIRGLEIGGDDYVTKPFNVQELIARIDSNLRRAPLFNRQFLSNGKQPIINSEEMVIGNMTINFQLQIVSVNGENIHLSTKEFQIFALLVKHPEKTFSEHELYKLIWGTDPLGATGTLKVHISNLRRKLETHIGHSSMIRTVRGHGYQFSI